MRFMADADRQFDAHNYPATTSELIEAYGETKLDMQNGTETLGDALGRLAEETHEDSESAKLAARSAVSEKAIGRKGYSDRDAPTVGEARDDLSF
ncbi:DUF5789 family protein [Natronomonas sp. EA1]|uniref:DUF5789 family protein n=1 Tax=Natronomonas sp. EA1 TaxID=3421655 RepID=UPI003EBFF0BF